MSEGSLPPFRRIGLRFSPASLLRQALGRLRPEGEPVEVERAGHPEDRERVASAIRAHAESHATLFERAERLRERAERLEREGTPSDSAINRAGRAEDEVRASLADLRSSFTAAGDLDAFDLELNRRYPAFDTSESS